ncbi:MAG: N-acetylmuramoyl-L-alanine amidase AmiB [Steroidobacteraceae bacterium]
MIALSTLAAVPAGAVEVSAVHVSATMEETRVTVDLSAAAAHRMSVLVHPNRVIVDVRHARLGRGVHGLPAAAGSIRSLRFVKGRAGDLRMVLDLSGRTRVRSFLQPPKGGSGYRLIVDLTAPAPVVAATGGQRRRPVRPDGVPVRAQHARPDARDLIIAIDAGHGGEDPGAIGKFGTQEKEVTLAIARALAQRVDSEPGMRAVLTRDNDTFVPLRDRMRRARMHQADLFVSIHADSIRDRSVDGSSVYILSQRGATDEASRWLAERQNAADLIGGVSLDDKGDVLASVLLDLSQSAALSASHAAAEHILRQLNRVGEIRKPQVQEARFVVLKSPDIPSMLVETAYISNPQEELRLRAAAHQAKLAAAIHQGLRAYFYDDPPPGTRIAQRVLGPVKPEDAGG